MLFLTNNYIKIFLIIVTLLNLNNCLMVKFTKLECQSYDKTFTEFKICQLKALGRHKISLNIYANLYERPLNNVTVSFL